MEKIISKINDTKDCNSSKDKKDFNHALKKHEVEEFINVKKANGVIKINTFKIIYLREYVKIKFNKLLNLK